MLPLHRPRSASLAGLLLASGLVAACEPLPSVDYLQAGLDGPVRIDSDCSDGGCEAPDALDVEFTWNEGGTFLDTDRILLKQYRIDYEIDEPEGEADGLDVPVPYFAGKFDQKVSFGETITFSLVTAGNTQRQVFEDVVPYDQIWAVTGTVTFAGFDEGNQVFEFAAGDFQIEVANFNNLQATVAPTVTTTTNGN